MESLTLTSQEVNSLVQYIKGIPSEWGTDLIIFFRKKIQDHQKEVEDSEKAPDATKESAKKAK